VSEPILEISDARVDRFASLRLIPWWEQARLENARVLVAGAGALGNEVLKNLALLGVHRIVVVDQDRVEASNLSRSVLFRADDAGLPKADVAARGVRALDPDARVVALDGPLQRTVGAGLLRRVDVVFGCLDNRGARIALNRLTARAGVLWIDGSLDVSVGAVRTFVPPGGPCYECSLTEQDYALALLRYACPFVPPGAALAGRVPTTPTTASIIAGMQVQLWLQALHGQAPTAGSRTIYDARALVVRSFVDARREGCPGHRTFRAVTPLPGASCRTTVGELVRLAEPWLAAPLTLRLDRPLVVRLDCPACGASERVLRPEVEVRPQELACPACGAARVPRVSSLLPCTDGVRDLPLRRLGVPPLDIVLLQSATGARGAFELSGDADDVLSPWEPDPVQETPS
jgi:molybdopterin/thiamine biosynthesis adenylyltransferase